MIDSLEDITSHKKHLSLIIKYMNGAPVAKCESPWKKQEIEDQLPSF